MNPFDRLSEIFERFPGIGPRQARRFVFHLLTEERATVTELAQLIGQAKDSMTECQSCFRFFAQQHGESTCSICTDTERDASLLMVLERDADISPLEKSGTYEGYYFILGGTIPLLHTEESKKLRGGALKAIIEKRLTQGLTEVILGFAVNPDGENTSRYVESLLAPWVASALLKVSTLGRGLSTGSELEYADPETIKNALKNRH